MSFWEDIQKTGEVTKGELTVDALRDFMTKLESNATHPKHNWVVYTGKGGMQMMNNAMQAEVYMQLLKKLKFSKEERKRLVSMIKSPDPENFEVAKILIDNKQNERSGSKFRK